jgi:hypothetical protein
MLIRILDDTQSVDINLPDRTLGGVAFSDSGVMITFAPVPTSIKIVPTKGDSSMPAVVKMKMTPVVKGAKKLAAPAPIQLTSATTGIMIETLDQNGNPILNVDPTTVSTTLTVADPTTGTVAPGADSLHYTLTIPANATAPINLSATEAFNSGSPGPFAATQEFLPPVPPSPTPTSIAIVIG